MKQEVTKTIDGVKYTFYQFNPRLGMKVLVKLAKIFGEPLGMIGESVISKGFKNVLASEVKELPVSKMVNSLVTRLDDSEVTELIDNLCDNIICDGKNLKEIFDVHFQGEYLRLFKVVKAALEVQYGNFFAAILGLLESNPPATVPEKST